MEKLFLMLFVIINIVACASGNGGTDHTDAGGSGTHDKLNSVSTQPKN